MECACQDEIVVYIELVEAFRKISLEDETSCLVDYDQGIYDPIIAIVSLRIICRRL